MAWHGSPPSKRGGGGGGGGGCGRGAGSSLIESNLIRLMDWIVASNEETCGRQQLRLVINGAGFALPFSGTFLSLSLSLSL